MLVRSRFLTTRALIRSMFLLLPLCCMEGLAASGPVVGKESPPLTGRTLDDSLYSLARDKQKPKVVNFFWVECKPCAVEMPELAKMEKKYPAFKFISVHTIPNTTNVSVEPQLVADFVTKLPAAPSTIITTGASVQSTFKFLGFPFTMVLDKNNVVLVTFDGFTPDGMQRLESYLSNFQN